MLAKFNALNRMVKNNSKLLLEPSRSLQSLGYRRGRVVGGGIRVAAWRMGEARTFTAEGTAFQGSAW